MNEAINKYLEIPVFAMQQLKTKKNRFSPFYKVKTKNLMFVENLENEIINNDSVLMELKTNYTNAALKLAFKNNIYFFESRIFNEDNIDKFFNEEAAKNIRYIKNNMINRLSSLTSEDLTKEDYLILISLIGKKDININIKRLMYTTYRDLLSKKNINLYEAEFLMKHTLDFRKTKIKSYISETSFDDEKLKTFAHYYYDEEERVLVLNKNHISRKPNNNKDCNISTEIVLNTLEIAFLQDDIDDLYDGVLNERTLELAIFTLLSSYLDNYNKDGILKAEHKNYLNAMHFFETKIQKNGSIKKLKKKTEEEGYIRFSENDIKVLDNIIYFYPEVLERYEILFNFYDEAGYRRKNVIKNDESNYIIDLFNKTIKKSKTLEKTPNRG